MADTRTPQNGQNETADDAQERTDDWRGSLRRSWYAMSDLLSPFSPSALAALPKKTFRTRPRYIRNDNVPEAQQDESGQMPTVRDYHSINDLPPQVRVPKKIATPIKVEGKVWFANERSALFSFCVHFMGLNLLACSLDRILEHFRLDRDAFSRIIQCLEGSNCS